MPAEDDPSGRDPRIATRGGEAGEAPAFEAPFTRTYGRPDRDRLRRGFLAYVQGHDRGWGAERKRQAAESTLAAEKRERSRGLPEGDPVAPGAGPAPAGLAAGADDRPSAGSGQARFGVPVPARLDFHRGPDLWRSRIGRPPGGKGTPADGEDGSSSSEDA